MYSKHQRQGAKASKIQSTISACRAHIQNKYDKDQNECARLEREIPEDIAFGREVKKAGASETELEALARRINEKKMQLFHLNSSKKIFGSTLAVLVELEAIIRVVAHHEWYRYIIRFVPYKKLPAMIRAEKASDMTRILELVKKSNEKIKQKVLESLHTEQQRQEFNDRLAEEMNVMNNMYGNQKPASSMFDEEAANPLPMSAEVEKPNTNVNPNNNMF